MLRLWPVSEGNAPGQGRAPAEQLKIGQDSSLLWYFRKGAKREVVSLDITDTYTHVYTRTHTHTLLQGSYQKVLFVCLF